MNKSKLLKNTTSYHDDLITALRDPREALAYLQVALEEYQEDNNAELFWVAIRNIAKTCRVD